MEVENDNQWVGVATGQMPVMHRADSGFQPPAPINQFKAGDKISAVYLAITAAKPSQRPSNADDEPRLDPPRDAGNDNGDDGQYMTDAAAKQQPPRRTRLKP